MQGITISYLVKWYATKTPLLLAWLVGLSVAIAYRRRYPRASLLSGLACAGFLMDALTTPVVYEYLLQQSAGLGVASTDMRFQLLTFCRMALWAALFGLLFVAIFARRTQPGRILGYDGQYLPEGFGPAGPRQEPREQPRP
jgi:hypothetical protein